MLTTIAYTALGFAGGRAVAAAVPTTGVAGTLRCAGGSTMRPLVETWGRRFHNRNPHAVIEVDPRVTLAADGFRELLAGRVDLVDFVREPFPSEIAAFRRKYGYAPLAINVANGSFETRGGTHAIAIYVNSSNPLQRLTLDQLRAIFSSEPHSGAEVSMSTWGDAGLKGSWARRPIHVYGMDPLRSTGNPPGIVNFMEIRVLRGGSFRADLRVERDRPRESALQAIVHAIAKDPDGIGYSGFGYALPGVKTIALAEHRGGTYVQGGPAQVANRSYPLSREIYFGLNSPPGRPLPPLLKAFLELVLSPEGQRAVAHTPERFIPLTADQIAQSRLQLLGRTARTGQNPPANTVSPAASSAPYLTANGAVSIVGYNDMREMLESLDAIFERTHPGVRFALTLKGTRTAPAALAAGRSLVAPMGAAFSPDELADYQRMVGSDPIPFRIAHDSLDPLARSAPLAIFVPASNPLPRLDFEQLQRIFAAAGGQLRWKQLGLTGVLANRPVRAYGLAPDTALGRFMSQRALSGRTFDKEFIGLPESADVVREVANDPLSIGFAAMNRATQAVRVVPLSRVRTERPSRGTRADLIGGRYPLDRYLLICVRVPPGGHLDPLARDYLRLALSPEGQRAIASGHLGYLPLGPKEAAAERARLEALP